MYRVATVCRRSLDTDADHADGMSVEPRAVFRTPEDLRVHRQRLYRRAAPVFRRHGYHGATLKQIASACGLSIPALYRYFPSKRDLALYPLSAANRPDGECFERASSDPVIHLRLWLDHAAAERPDFLLALRLTAGMGEEGRLSDEHIETFRFHIGLVADVLRATAPALPERRAREMVETLLAMSLGAPAIGSDWVAEMAWTRFVRLLEPDLVRGGANASRLRDVLSSLQEHPEHGPCSLGLASKGDFFAKSPVHSTTVLGEA